MFEIYTPEEKKIQNVLISTILVLSGTLVLLVVLKPKPKNKKRKK